MNEEVKVLDVVWVRQLFLGTVVIAILIGVDYKFLPYYINTLPILAWFGGAVVGIWIWSQMKHWRFRRVLATSMVLLGAIVTSILVVDRFGDFSSPEVVPARVIRHHEARFVASSDLLVELTFSNGESFQTSVGASQFPRLPMPGTTGKAVIGRGLFGIRYLKSVEF